MNPLRKRIYLGNLPFDTTEDEVTKKFSKFGTVLNVEMKYQSDTSFDVGLPCYAFLDLGIRGQNDLDNCFSKIKSRDWRGNTVKIEIAKESFLSRLQRERKSNDQTTQDPIASPILAGNFSTELKTGTGRHIKFDDNKELESPEESPIVKKHKKSKKHDEPAVESPSEVTPKESNVLDKFESFSDVWKDDPPEEKDSTKKKEKKDKKKKKEKTKEDHVELAVPEEISNEERNKIAEERRLKSLADREKSVKQQKEAVKLALSSVDSNKKNNRLTFKDDDDEEPEIQSRNQTQDNKADKQSRKNPGLFPDQDSSGDEGEDINFAVKKQFEGKRGQKLLDLKSKYGNDKRFTLDERFYESDEEKKEASADVSTSDEVQRQLEILKGIVGDNLPRGPKKTDVDSKKRDENLMLRFDPTVADHRKFELPKEDQSKTQKQEKNKRKQEDQQPAFEVSRAKYYKVADSLKESLKTAEGGGFSLLEMFGERIDVESEDKHVKMEKERVDWKSNRSQSTPKALRERPVEKAEHSSNSASWGETFFFKSDDPRLFEGIKFFKTESEDHGFRELRYELREICRHKLETARKRAKETRSGYGKATHRGAFRGASRGHRGRH